MTRPLPVRARAAAALLASLLGGTAAAQDARSVRVDVSVADLATAPDARGDWLVTPALDARLAVAAVAAHWPGATGAELELSVSPDGLLWGPWIAVPPDEPVPAFREDGAPNAFAGESRGALVFVDPASRHVRCRVRASSASGPGEVPGRISLVVVDAGTGVELERLEGAGRLRAGGAATFRRAAAPPPELPGTVPGPPKPRIWARSSWGARPPKAGYTYTVAGHVALHHTATVEDFAASTWDECAARVRAIQTYHMDANGWNDIGYAYVVCRHGDVFQAREDDDDTRDVQGAHDGLNRGSTGVSAFGYFHPPVDHRPTPEQLSSLVSLTAWIAGLREFDPLGRSLYEPLGAPVDNVYGHREVSATACPGDNLFALKEQIRAAAAERVLRMPY